jgi:predicted Zn finger-like uncharacterized protein
MIVTCPVCGARYLADPRALGTTGRWVRCTRCNHVWDQAPAEDAPRRVDLARLRANDARPSFWLRATMARRSPAPRGAQNRDDSPTRRPD